MNTIIEHIKEKERIKVIEFKSKKILFVDHSGLKGDDLRDNIEKAAEFMQKRNEKFLLLLNFTDTKAFVSVKTLIESAELLKLMQQKANKTALLGVKWFLGTFELAYKTAYQFFTGIRPTMERFENESTAMQWLSSNDDI